MPHISMDMPTHTHTPLFNDRSTASSIRTVSLRNRAESIIIIINNMSRNVLVAMTLLLTWSAQTSLSLPQKEQAAAGAGGGGGGTAPKGGKCTTSADCIAPNVCSKWGWCQWTKIYGEEGPSQGAGAPGGGHSGQCRTSADCGSRVPFCSVLGYCHGGTLPFDEQQLEIPSDVLQAQPDDQPDGFINNDPVKNSPVFKGGAAGGGGQGKSSRSKIGGGGSDDLVSQVKANSGGGGRISSSQGKVDFSNSRGCPEESAEECVAKACQAMKDLKRVFDVCAKECRERCK